MIVTYKEAPFPVHKLCPRTHHCVRHPMIPRSSGFFLMFISNHVKKTLIQYIDLSSGYTTKYSIYKTDSWLLYFRYGQAVFDFHRKKNGCSHHRRTIVYSALLRKLCTIFLELEQDLLLQAYFPQYSFSTRMPFFVLLYSRRHL